MPEPSESKVIRKFRERVERGDLTRNVKVIYRIAGGMPSQRVEQEFRLSGKGRAKTMRRDVLRSIPAKSATGKLDQAKTRDLFQKIGSGLDSLVPRSKARFLPDSVVGSITVEVDGERAKLYFLADEEARREQSKPVSPDISEAIRLIRNNSERLLKGR